MYLYIKELELEISLKYTEKETIYTNDSLHPKSLLLSNK